MDNVINIEAITIVNGMALVLASQLFFGNNWKYENKDWKYLKIILFVSAGACIIDPIVF